MLATLRLDIGNETWSIVARRPENDLLEEITGGCRFVKNKYEWGYVVNEGTSQITVEYINDKWYYLEYERQTGSFITKENLALTETQLRKHRLSCQRRPPETNILTP